MSSAHDVPAYADLLNGVNPFTGKSIQINGPTYKKIMKQFGLQVQPDLSAPSAKKAKVNTTTDPISALVPKPATAPVVGNSVAKLAPLPQPPQWSWNATLLKFEQNVAAPKLNSNSVPTHCPAYSSSLQGIAANFAPLFQLPQWSWNATLLKFEQNVAAPLPVAPKPSSDDVPTHCPACSTSLKYIPMHSATEHIEACTIRLNRENEDSKVAIEMGREVMTQCLSTIQRAAINYLQRQSKDASDKAFPALLLRFQQLKMTEAHLVRVLLYIRDRAPLLIHLNLRSCLKSLIADTNYRNMFEIRPAGYDCGRVHFENKLFNKIYHEMVAASERVKYGVMNIANNPNGVQSCYGYGDSYLLLRRPEVLYRTSFAQCDSFSPGTMLATCEHYCHVLNQAPNADLEMLKRIACGEIEFGQSIDLHYKEIQIHGPLRLNVDVEAIVVPIQYQQDGELCMQLQQLVSKNNFELRWKPM